MNAARMFELTKKLVSIPSQTGSESAICDYLSDHLKSLGMIVEEQEISPGRRNIYARWTDDAPAILFNTHLDTVPPQYGPFEDEDHIFGRGSCDTHGILASQLEAILELHDMGRDDVGALFVVGEEVGHDGAIGAADNFAEPKVVIVGEPTDNKLVRGGKGLLGIEIEAHGIAGHSSAPEKSDSAIEKLLDLLRMLRDDCASIPADSVLGKTTLNIGTIRGGEAHNIITDSATCGLLYRLTIPKDEAVKRVEEVLNKSNENKYHSDCTTNFTWEYTDVADPLTTVETLPDFETSIIAFGTDIPFFGWKDTRYFLLGPGSVLKAHRAPSEDLKMGEYIAKQEMIDAVELYKRLVSGLT